MAVGPASVSPIPPAEEPLSIAGVQTFLRKLPDAAAEKVRAILEAAAQEAAVAAGMAAAAAAQPSSRGAGSTPV